MNLIVKVKNHLTGLMHFLELIGVSILIGPLLITTLGLLFSFIETGINTLLRSLPVDASRNRNIGIFGLYLIIYIVSCCIVITTLETVFVLDGVFMPLYLVSLIVNFLSLWMASKIF